MNELDRDIAWLDFVRGVADRETKQRIQNKIASGSEDDKKGTGLWSRVAAVGHNDRERPVPDGLSRIAKAMGSVYLPRPEERGLRRWVAELAFEGSSTPVGVRSGTPSNERHSVFKSGSYLFDVRLEDLSSGSCRLDGQVYLQDEEQSLGEEIPVLIFSDDDLIGSTWCNEHGEFQSDELRQKPSMLHLVVERDLQVELQLP